MSHDHTAPAAPGLPWRNERPPAAPSIDPEGDTPLPAAARLVIEEPAQQCATSPAGAPSLSLTQLAGQWEALNRDADEAWKRLQIAEEAATRIMPPIPEICQNDHGYLAGRETLAEVDAMDRRRYGEHIGSPRVAAYDLYNAQFDAIQSSFGVPGLEQIADRAQAAANITADLVMTLRPTTLHEAALKYRVIRIRFEDGKGGFDQPEKLHEFQADLDYLASVAQA